MEPISPSKRSIEPFIDLEALPAGSDAQAQERTSPNLFRVIGDPPELEDSILQDIMPVKDSYQPLSAEVTGIGGGATLPMIIPIPIQPRKGVRNRTARRNDKATWNQVRSKDICIRVNNLNKIKGVFAYTNVDSKDIVVVTDKLIG
jgi:hypothetical protein